MIVYLHGFASSPGSHKAQFFQRRFTALGAPLLLPELDGGDFTHMTLSSQLQVVEKTCAARPPGAPLLLIGSSMGGYLATLHAAQHEVTALVLLAPAVDFAARWRERLGDAELARWQRDGSIEVEHHALRRRVPLSYALMADAERQPAWPQVRAPVLVLHGRRDDVVPQARVERWVAQTPGARLVLLDTGHEMTDCMPQLAAEAQRFLAAIPAVAAAYPALVSANIDL